MTSMDKDAKLFKSHMELQTAINERNTLRSEVSLLKAKDDQLMEERKKYVNACIYLRIW
jgi:hypothetical protein